MFRREIKKQFNENKYNVLTQKGMTGDLTDSRYFAEIPALQGPLPEAVGRLPCPNRSRL